MLRLTLIAMLLLPHVAGAQTAFERAGVVVLDGGDFQDAAAALEAGCADGDGLACRVRYYWGKRDIVAAADPALIRSHLTTGACRFRPAKMGTRTHANSLPEICPACPSPGRPPPVRKTS